MTKKLKILGFLTLLLKVSLLMSCVSNTGVPHNTQIMNIWVAPEYAEASELTSENYIAVFITQAGYLPDAGTPVEIDFIE